MALPKLIAFDLDDTLWHPEMWLCSGTPYSVPDASTGKVFCAGGEEMQFLGDARAVLRLLHDPDGPFRAQGVKVVYVSRTSYPEYAFPLLELMPVSSPPGASMADVGESDLHQIYPMCKVEHFSKIHEATGIAYADMLFFDNEHRNIVDVEAMGVKCVYTPDGLFWQHFRDGLAKFGHSSAFGEAATAATAATVAAPATAAPAPATPAPAAASYPPLIDLEAFAQDEDSHSSEARRQQQQQHKQETAEALRRACIDVGFFWVKSRALSKESNGGRDVIADAFAATRALFDLPQSSKDACDATRHPLFRGYQGVSSLSHSCTPEDDVADDDDGAKSFRIQPQEQHRPSRPDLKESFTIGAQGSFSPMHGTNNWPEAMSSSSSSTAKPVAALREKLQRYWDQCTAVSLEIARALALSLGLDEHFFTQRMDKAVAQMVLLRYPPPPSGSQQAGCGAHTDCGFLTLLQQDLNGLEIKDKQGKWVEAPRLEREDVVLVNLGDMAARWSNGLYKSTWHRVNNKTGRLRHSIPFFCNTNFDALVDPKTSVCAGSLSDVAGEARFEPVKAGQYLCEKLGLMWGDDKI